MPRSSVAVNGMIAEAEYRQPVGGALCLDFINTVDLHAPDAAPTFDYLAPGYANLLAWSSHAGTVDEQTHASLLRLARKDGRQAAAVRQRAIHLREALVRIVHALRWDEPQPLAAMDAFSLELDLARARQRLIMRDGYLTWEFSEENALDAILWPIAISAIDLLGTDAVRRIGECEGTACDWLFIDTSKNHSRRFCSTTGCGNAARIRRYRTRERESRIAV
jgi:predicted RNA-binding Zn ribbon-like protein